jgi:hypothetical protein
MASVSKYNYSQKIDSIEDAFTTSKWPYSRNELTARKWIRFKIATVDISGRKVLSLELALRVI